MSTTRQRLSSWFWEGLETMASISDSTSGVSSHKSSTPVQVA
jgi:hypothetical protein